MSVDSLIILTGPFGSGKSTLLQHFRTLGFQGIEEPARPILAEQRRIKGTGLPDKDPRLFVDLMLSRMIGDYHRTETVSKPVFFDRGVPDMLAYAAVFGFDYPQGRNAASVYRYHRRVFLPLRGRRSTQRMRSERSLILVPGRLSFGRSTSSTNTN